MHYPAKNRRANVTRPLLFILTLAALWLLVTHSYVVSLEVDTYRLHLAPAQAQPTPVAGE